MTVDDWLKRIRERGYRVSLLQQCGDGMWQAALRGRDGEGFLPARCHTAADALEVALRHADAKKFVRWADFPLPLGTANSDVFA